MKKFLFVLFFILVLALLALGSWLLISYKTPFILNKFSKIELKASFFRVYPFKGLVADSVYVGDNLFVEHVEAKFSIFSFLRREIEEVQFRGVRYSIKGKRKGTKASPVTMPFSIKNLRVENVTVYRDGNEVIFLKSTFGYAKRREIGGTFALIIDSVRVYRKFSLHDIKISADLNGEEFYLYANLKGDLTAEINVEGKKDSLKFLAEDVTLGNVEVEKILGSFKKKRGWVRLYNLVVKDINLRQAQFDFSLSKNRLTLRNIRAQFPLGVVSGKFEIANIKNLSYSGELYLKRFHLIDVGMKEDAVFWGRIKVKGQRDTLSLRGMIERAIYRDLSLSNIGILCSLKGRYIQLNRLSIEDEKLHAYLTGHLSGAENFEISGQVQVDTLFRIPLRNFKNIKTTLTLSGKLKKRGGDISADIEGFGRMLEVSELRVDSFRFSFKTLKEGLRLEAYGLRAKGFLYDSLRLSIGYNRADYAPYRVIAYRGPFKFLHVDGMWLYRDGELTLKNEFFHMVHPLFTGELDQPVEIVYKKGGLKINTKDQVVFGGRLRNFELSFQNKGNFILRTDIEDLNLEEFSKLVGRIDLKGYASLSLEGRGSLSFPEFSLALNVKEFERGDLKGLAIYSHMYYKEGWLKIADFELLDYGNPVSLAMTLPVYFSLSPYRLEFNSFAPLQGRLLTTGAHSEFLEKLLGGTFVFEGGRVIADLRLSGTFTDPVINGLFKVEAPEGVFTPLRMVLKDFKLDGRFVNSTLYMDSIYSKTLVEGYLRGRGYLTFEGMKPESLVLSIDVFRSRVEPNPYTEAVATGMVTVKGKLPGIFIDADVNVEKGYLFLGFGGSGGGTKSPSPIRYRIRISADKGVYLINNFAEIEFSTDLEIKKLDEVNILITGNLKVLEGTFMYLDRVFVINEGEIQFVGGRELNPTLNLRGETTIEDSIVIYLNVGGTLKTPVIELTSTPPMSQEDIISYILFGKPMKAVPLTLNDVNLIRERALNLAEGLLSRELQRKLRISELELRTGLAGEDPRFTVGFYVSPRLYVKYTHDLLALEKDVFLMRYFLTRRMAIYAERDRDGEISTGLEFNLRF